MNLIILTLADLCQTYYQFDKYKTLPTTKYNLLELLKDFELYIKPTYYNYDLISIMTSEIDRFLIILKMQEIKPDQFQSSSIITNSLI